MQILLALLTAAAAASSEPSVVREVDPKAHSDFRNRVRELAQAERLTITQWGPGDIDGDGRVDESVAFVCAPRGSTSFESGFLVGDEKGRLWAIGWPFACGRPEARPPDWTPPLPPWSTHVLRGIELGDGQFECRMGLVDDAFEIVQVTTSTRSNIASGRWTTDWRLRTREGGYHQGWEGGLSYSDEAAMVVVEGPDTDGSRPTPPETFNVILSGQDQWQGREDAALSVRAIQADPAHVRLEIRIQDDRFVPRDEGGGASDRLELWWVGCAQGCDDGPSGRWHLQIAWSPSGAVTAGWSQSEAGGDPPLPEVSAAGGARGERIVHLLLPEASLLHRNSRTLHLGEDAIDFDDGPDGGWNTQFAAVYSDVDTPGGQVETVVATSRQASEGTTLLGMLVKHPGFRPFPTDMEGFRERIKVRSIRLLDPAATHIAEPPRTTGPTTGQ